MKEPEPPPTIFIKYMNDSEEIQHAKGNEVYFQVCKNKIKFLTLHQSYSVSEDGSLHYMDILVMKPNILADQYYKNRLEIFPQNLKVCKSCSTFYYNFKSHNDIQHKMIAENMSIISSSPKNTKSPLTVEIVHQIGLTEYAYQREDRYIIHSESENTRSVLLKIRNRSSNNIKITKCVADNSRNGFITWSAGTQMGDLRIYPFDEELLPNTLSQETIQINIPGQFPVSKDMTLKVKTIDERTNKENLYDIELTIFNNYLPPEEEETLEPRNHKHWVCQKPDRDDSTDSDLNTKACHTPPKTLFQTLTPYQELQHQLMNHPPHLPVNEKSLSLPKEVFEIYELLNTPTNRDNWKKRIAHYLKCELVHYLTHMLKTCPTKVLKVNKLGLTTELTLDLDMSTLSSLNLKANDEALIKIQDKVIPAQVSLTEIKQTTIKIESLLNVPLNSQIQVAPTLRSAPFAIVFRALEDTESLDISLATKNYFLPNRVITQGKPTPIEPADKGLDDCQLEAVTKMNHLAPGDTFVLQGPPGTGKSRTLLEFIHQRLLLNETVLVVCPTNSAIVDFFGKMKRCETFKGRKILKISNPTARVEKTCESFCTLLTDGDMRHKLPHPKQVMDAQVIICTHLTTHRLNNIRPCTPNTDTNTKGWSKTFQNVVIDEAAFCPEPTVLVPIVRNITGGQKKFRLILSGDPLQLTQSPNSVIITQQEDIMTRCAKFLSKHESNFHFLRNNYRSSNKIVDILNDISYNGELVCRRRDTGEVTVIHCETSQKSLTSKSKFSAPEAATVIRYVKNQPGNEPHCVLSYYTAQKIKVLEEAEAKSCRNVLSSTIENIQGLECKNIILTTVLPSIHNPWHLSKRRANVVASRAQDSLTLIGNLLDLQRHPILKFIIRHATKIIAPDNIRAKVEFHNRSCHTENKRKKVIQRSLKSNLK